MMNTSPFTSMSREQWDALIDQFLASGLSQKDFCERGSIPIHRFKYYYRLSDKFAGRRRQRSAATAAEAEPSPSRTGPSAFKPVKACAPSAGPVVPGDLCIRVGQGVQVQCTAETGIDVIMRLVQEGL